MSKEELAGKLLSDLSNVNLHDLTGADREEISKLGDAKMELDSRPILLDDRSETTVRQIRGKVERLQAKSKVSMVVIDYLQLLTSSDITRASSQNEAVRVGDISRALKLMAKDCKIPVIVLSQLNREIEKRSNRTPQLSDLRDSGAIEQDADMVIFIDRKIQPDVSEDLQEKEGKIIIAKHRNGPTGYIPVEWEGQYSRYKEVERQTSNAAPAQWGRQTIDEWV
jgi:replicative DNA helicase